MANKLLGLKSSNMFNKQISSTNLSYHFTLYTLAGVFSLIVPMLWIFIEIYWPEIPEDIQNRFDSYYEKTACE